MSEISRAGLILDLPFYKLDGGKFMSADAYGHLCTASGAIWTPQGRSFDGTDDYIALPYSSLYDFGTGDFAVEVWFYPQNQIDKAIVTRWQQGNLAWDLRLGQTVDPGKLLFLFGSVPNTYIIVSGDVSQTSYHHAVATRLGGRLWGYLDLVSLDAGIQSGNASNTAATLRVGNYPGFETGHLKGLVGEVRIYNRGLPPQEVLNNHLATKWRYR